MNRIVEALKKTKVFYIATVDESGAPQVRPFGSVTEYEGGIYLCTNNTKAVYREIMHQPKIALCGMDGGTWLRVTGTAVRVDSDDARRAMLADPTGPSGLYTVGDGIFEVFRIDDARAVLYSFEAAPVVIEP